MAKPLAKTPAPPAPDPEPQDWAVLALLALAPEGFRVESLLQGAKHLLSALGLPSPKDEAALMDRLMLCQAHHLAHVERWGSARCAASQRDPVLLRAWREGWSTALGAAFRVIRGDYEFSSYPTERAFKLALVTDAFDAFQEMAGRFDLPKTSASAVLEVVASAVPRPLDPAWLRHLPPNTAMLVAAALMNRALLTWEPLEPLAAWLDSHPRDSATQSLYLETLLYQGRFQEVEEELRRQNAGGEPIWPAHIEGLHAFLQGRGDAAVAAFQRAWERVKAQNKRIRTPLLPGPLGWFHALALLQTGQADQAERLAKVYGGRGYQDQHSRVWDGILDLAILAQGRHLERHQNLPSGPDRGAMECFVHAHASFWLDPARFRASKMDGFLASLGKMAEQCGAPWLLLQVRALERQWRGLPADGPRALGDFMEAIPPWQRTLDSLARMGQELPELRPARAAKPRRLAWVVRRHRNFDAFEAWGLEARDQRQDKDGSWGPGKVVPLTKVRSASVGMAFLQPADHRAIEATTDKPYATRDDIWRVLYALAGHEALFLEVRGQLQPLEVRQSEPELRVRTEPDGLRLELYPECDGGAHQVVEEAPDRMTVYAFSARHREVGALLGGQGLRVPATAQDQVAKAVAGVASLLAVHSDLPLAAAGAGLEEVEADATPELDLRPWGEGLRAQLRVRPVAGGPPFVPGAGAGELILEVGGRRCRTHRDLPREQNLASALLEACPALDGGGWEWQLEEPMDCLQLMLALEPLKGQVRVAWPEGERFKAPQRVGAKRLHLGLKGEGQWFALTGHLQLDEGRILALQDLLALLPQAKGDFVPLGEGLWLNLERHFRDRLEGLKGLAVTHGANLRLAPASALGLEELTREAGQFTAPKAWKDRAAAIRRAFAAEIAVPATLQATLRPYQEEGFQWLARLAEAGLGSCLADDMGLGKTVQALALLLRRASLGPALVVAPMSVVGNWAVEARRFAPTLEVRVFGEGDRTETLATAGPFTLVLCTYGLLVQEQERLTAPSWSSVILDEAQAIKNAETQRSKAVMALKAEARVAMSGTPVENHLGELWNLFRFLNPGLLGSAEHFTRTFAAPIERDRDRGSLQRLKRILKPFLLRRTKQEVLQDLPSLTEIVHEVILSAPERTFYETLRRQALEKLTEQTSDTAGRGQGHLQILAELMRLRRACCHPRLVEPKLSLPSAKLEAFAEILGELRENRHKALVFSQFVDHLAVLRELLDHEGIPYQYLDGATSAPERRKRIDAFQAGEGDLFLISLKAGGTGLNLTAADYVIHMDPWWNPAVEDQASGRAHRIGQDRPVTVYRLVAKDTIEEKILALHHQKRNLADGILEGAGATAALSAEDLMALLRA